MEKDSQSKKLGNNLFIESAIDKWSKSIIHLTLPDDLLAKSKIQNVIDSSCLIIRCLMLYGLRKGTKSYIPYDGSEVKKKINDLTSESLWIYGEDNKTNLPDGFKTSFGLFSSSWKPFNIGTGSLRKCPLCRGKGLVKCSKCNGRGKYERGFIGTTEKTWELCSCGNGYIDCSSCSGYGTIQDSIKCETSFHNHSQKTLLYNGPDFDNETAENTSAMISNTTGFLLFEKVFEYPYDEMCQISKGGVKSEAYLKNQNIIKNHLKNSVIKKVNNKNIDSQIIFNTISRCIDNTPNPSKLNKVLEYEILPIRIRINIQDIPVFKVKYIYNKKPYDLWVYGEEGKIYALSKPKELTLKLKIFLILIGFVIFSSIIVFLVYLYTNNLNIILEF